MDDRHGKKRVRHEQSEQPAGGAVLIAAKPSQADPSKRRKANKKVQDGHAPGAPPSEGVAPLQDKMAEESRNGGGGGGEASGVHVHVHRPPGLFEFPWQKGGRLVIPELDGSDLRDVFFKSLVDGCSAAIGIPGDRLTAGPRPVRLSEISGLWPSYGEADGADSVLSSTVLRQRPRAAMREKFSGRVSDIFLP